MSIKERKLPKPRRDKKQKTPLAGLPGPGSTVEELRRSIAVHAQRRQMCLEEQEKIRKQLWAMLPTVKTGYGMLNLQAQMEQWGSWAKTIEGKEAEMRRDLWRLENRGRMLPFEMEERDDGEGQ